ncbi:hypothetical protein DFJ77DRAFT_462903 [Powellomyces hirtus]|nr:hypothetical protein DFJ77DRAFT_462903 [Powellomyces hirtus]
MDPQTLYNRLHKRPSRPVIGSNPNPLNSTSQVHYTLPPTAPATDQQPQPQQQQQQQRQQQQPTPSMLRLGSSVPSHRQQFGGRERTLSNATLPTVVRRVHEMPFKRGVVIGSLKEDSSGFVMGPPTRAHWKPDVEAPECEKCNQRFGFLLRRHHCRRCGGVFCLSCSSHFIRLDQNANFHPAGLVCRVCDSCYAEYESRGTRSILGVANSTSDSSINNNNNSTEENTIPPEAARDPNQADVAKAVPIAAGKQDKVPEAAMSLMSVPSDWQWSTF